MITNVPIKAIPAPISSNLSGVFLSPASNFAQASQEKQ
jgi:hypothetical protein